MSPEARQLIVRGKARIVRGWFRGNDYHNAPYYEHGVEALYGVVTRDYCAGNAIWGEPSSMFGGGILGYQGKEEALMLLAEEIGDYPMPSATSSFPEANPGYLHKIVAWNNDPSRTKEEVISLYDRVLLKQDAKREIKVSAVSEKVGGTMPVDISSVSEDSSLPVREASLA
jgi:hypothetical protein